MPIAFVTGANGFVGQHLSQWLIDEDWELHALLREGADRGILETLPIQAHAGDLTDRDSVIAAMPEQCEAVFHVAASTNMWTPNNALQTRINVDGTRHVIDAARIRGARRLVHTSTVAVFGFVHGLINENTPRDDRGDWINYIRTKTEAERLALAANDTDLEVVVVNPAHVMGPLDRHNWVRLFQMIAEQRLPGIPPGSGSFVDVRQVARAHLSAARQGRPGERYLLGGVNARFVELVEEVARQLDCPVTARQVPGWLLSAMARLRSGLGRLRGIEPDITPESAALVSGDERVDSSRAIAELGLTVTPLDVLIADTLAWMTDEKLLP